MLHEDWDTFTSNNYFHLITNMTMLFFIGFPPQRPKIEILSIPEEGI